MSFWMFMNNFQLSINVYKKRATTVSGRKEGYTTLQKVGKHESSKLTVIWCYFAAFEQLSNHFAKCKYVVPFIAIPLIVTVVDGNTFY